MHRVALTLMAFVAGLFLLGQAMTGARHGAGQAVKAQPEATPLRLQTRSAAAAPKPLPDPAPPAVADVLQSGVLIVVSTASQRMHVFKDGKLWRSAPVSTGRRGHATPSGVFPILQKRVYHRSNIYSNAPMPFMQRLTWSGIAIHAGYLPGYPASHGCIRVPRDVARSLFALTRFGATTVIVTNDKVGSDAYARQLALDFPEPGQKEPLHPAQSERPALAAAETQTEPAPAPGDQTIQLAASSTSAEAEAHWAELVAERPQLAGFRKIVIPAVVKSRQVYRLRASAPGAHAYCARLQSEGVACFAVS